MNSLHRGREFNLKALMIDKYKFHSSSHLQKNKSNAPTSTPMKVLCIICAIAFRNLSPPLKFPYKPTVAGTSLQFLQLQYQVVIKLYSKTQIHNPFMLCFLIPENLEFTYVTSAFWVFNRIHNDELLIDLQAFLAIHNGTSRLLNGNPT
jgi:hypothetical protein